jgi:hypothetical protein
VLPAAVITALHPAGSPRSHNEAFRITDWNIAAGNQAAPSRRSALGARGPCATASDVV